MPIADSTFRSVRRGLIVEALLVLVVSLGLLTACDSGGMNGETGMPARVRLTFADDASFIVDSTVTATATVLDAEERPVKGATVNWTAEQGQLDSSMTSTDADGTTQTRWTLGPKTTGSDAQSLTASIEGATDVATSQAVDVNPGPVTSIFVQANRDTIAVDSSATLSIDRLEDANGNRIQNLSQYTFTWNSLTPDTATVTSGDPSTSAQVQGVGHGAAQVTVSTGGAPKAGLAAIQSASGAAADTIEIEVLEHELRGVWLTTTDSNVLNSRANIEEAMDFLAEHNFNTVFPVVWNNAATTYPSTVMDTLIGRPIKPEFEGRDPLQEVVEEAHERGIAVIPWFEFGFAASFSADGGPIIEEKPSWAAKDKDGNLLTKQGFEWMNAYKPAVRDFMMALILEVIRNYDVDGVQGDDRLPASPVEGGYSEFTKQLYRQEHDGQDPPSNESDSEWMQWRADKLNAFGQRVYDEVKAVDEDLVVSWSPSVWRFSFREFLQDWPAWINQGFTDLMHPQVYRRDVGAYKETLNAQGPSRVGWDEDAIIGFYPGVLLKVGGFVATPEDIKTMVRANRKRGYMGEVFFFYEGLREFDADVAEALKRTHYRDPAPLPFKRASRH